MGQWDLSERKKIEGSQKKICSADNRSKEFSG